VETAAQRVPGIAPDGTPITLPREKVGALEASGGHTISDQQAEVERAKIAQAHEAATPAGAAENYGESVLAGMHSLARGEGEAAGIPIDRGITGIASLFGGEEAAKKTGSYLKGLDQKHPYLTGFTGLEGNVAGALGVAELTGGLGNPMSMKALAAPRTAANVAARMAAGGAENVVMSTTRDINEAALGNHEVNGEKLLAAAPGRFLMGAALTGGFEAGAHILGKGLSAAKRGLVPALEEGADRAVGREVGAAGEEAASVGKRVRGLAEEHEGVSVPSDRTQLADILAAEQGAQRSRHATEHAGIVDALAGEQATEAGALSIRQEAARKAAARAGQRGVTEAEGAAAETHLEGMARGGARVEQAELEGYAKRSAAHGEAFDRNMASAVAEGRAGPAALHEEMAAATRTMNQIDEHYGALRQALAEEHAVATRTADDLAAERAANSKDLAAALKEVREGGHTAPGNQLTHSQFDDIVQEYLGITGHKGDPSARWAAEKQLLAIYGEPIEEAAAMAGTGEKVARLQGLADHLGKAHEEALAHVATVEAAARTTEAQAAKDMALAARATDARIATFQKVTSKEAAQAGKLADQALAKVRAVEEQTAAAVEKARAVGQKEAEAARVAGEKQVAAARAQAEAAQANVERVATKERAALEREHSAEIRKLPKLRTDTDVDPLIEGMNAPRERPPLVSSGAALGAGWSLLHGNPVAAVTSLAASFAAGRLRGHGNLAAARALRGVSQALTHIDDAVQKGTALILGQVGARVAKSAIDKVERPTKKPPKFDDIASELYAAQANPMILERRVTEGLGPLAKTAPQTYAETLASTQRAHAFLLGILPRPQRDPHSLTPQFDPSIIDESTKYEFMKSYGTVVDPLSIYKDVHDKSVTEQQVQAIEEVYPRLYAQMKNEVERQKLFLTKPIEYDRAIHVGTLLGVITDEVLEPDFQAALAANYEDKEAAGAPEGSKGSSGESKLAKSMMSASENVEGGMQ